MAPAPRFPRRAVRARAEPRTHPSGAPPTAARRSRRRVDLGAPEPAARLASVAHVLPDIARSTCDASGLEPHIAAEHRSRPPQASRRPPGARGIFASPRRPPARRATSRARAARHRRSRVSRGACRPGAAGACGTHCARDGAHVPPDIRGHRATRPDLSRIQRPNIGRVRSGVAGGRPGARSTAPWPSRPPARRATDRVRPARRRRQPEQPTARAHQQRPARELQPEPDPRPRRGVGVQPAHLAGVVEVAARRTRGPRAAPPRRTRPPRRRRVARRAGPRPRASRARGPRSPGGRGRGGPSR